MYNRDLQKELARLSKQWTVISVTGPRQSGKTTLCKMTFPDYEYVNLEHLPTRNRVADDVDSFIRKHSKGIIFDEAQYLPEPFSNIQVWADNDKSRRFVLSGSSDFLIMQNITQSLAGRVAVVRLLPLSISELKEDIGRFSTDELMIRGYFPGVWGDMKNPCDIYENYIATYLQRDVRQIVNVKNLQLFQHFLVLCAGRVGSEFNALALSSEIGVSSVTIKEWLRILETSYVAFQLSPYYANIGKRLSKMPKIYFYDVGLVCQLLGITDTKQLEVHPLRGAIFENMVVAEMLKQRFNTGKPSNLYFYRDKSKREVDILQVDGLQMKAYEVKSAQRYDLSFFKNLKYLKELLGNNLISTQVIYDGEDNDYDSVNGIFNFRNIAKMKQIEDKLNS
ncbi:MAG: ATP-binding protein [Bacteroidales bacterium]|nr:ATP-binding protein [Bacteroidales bacterium]